MKRNLFYSLLNNTLVFVSARCRPKAENDVDHFLRKCVSSEKPHLYLDLIFFSEVIIQISKKFLNNILNDYFRLLTVLTLNASMIGYLFILKKNFVS